jgi:hypothetical protein
MENLHDIEGDTRRLDALIGDLLFVVVGYLDLSSTLALSFVSKFFSKFIDSIEENKLKLHLNDCEIRSDPLIVAFPLEQCIANAYPSLLCFFITLFWEQIRNFQSGLSRIFGVGIKKLRLDMLELFVAELKSKGSDVSTMPEKWFSPLFDVAVRIHSDEAVDFIVKHFDLKERDPVAKIRKRIHQIRLAVDGALGPKDVNALMESRSLSLGDLHRLFMKNGTNTY